MQETPLQSPNSTYEISQYNKKQRQMIPDRNTMSASFNQSTNRGYNYDQYFNWNYQNSVALTDYEDEMKKRREAESYQDLLNQNNQLINQLKYFQDEIAKLHEDNSFLENKVGTLSEQNEEMSRLINEQKNQLMLISNEKGSVKDHQNLLEDELHKVKSKLSQQLKESENMLNQNDKLSKELNNLRRDYLELENKNKEMGLALRSNQSQLMSLDKENKNLKDDWFSKHANKEAVIDDLKSNVDYLRDKMDQAEKDKNNALKSYSKLQETSENEIKKLSDDWKNAWQENEELAHKANDFKKINQKLIREKDVMNNKIKQWESDLNTALNKNNKSMKNIQGENPMWLNCLKNENADLREWNETYKNIIDILLKFINEWNDLFNHDEISLPQCKDNINDLLDDLDMLRQDINNWVKGVNDEDDKWNDIQNKLWNKNNKEVDHNDARVEAGRNNKGLCIHYKKGKCSACDMGRNVSLKGASPHLVNMK